MRSIFVSALALGSLCVSSIVIAQAPDLLSFQGYVTDSVGTPINHPGIPIRFRLTDVSAPVWLETQPSVKIVDGVFNVRLGSVVPLDTVRFNRPLLLRIKVGTDPEILPHTPLAAAAYAKALPGLYTFYREADNNKSYNVVGGSSNNVVGAGVTGATIAGGGGVFFITDQPNSVLATHGTVGGGRSNTASGLSSTVGGGAINTASSQFSTVGGGILNTASNFQATVPGGQANTASGILSFAAGFKSQAIHTGTFVWSSASDLSDGLVSTGPNQFLIRATGGVGINTNQPLYNSKLHVEHDSVGTNDWGVVVTNSFHPAHQMGMRLANSGFFEITNSANTPGPSFARLDNTGNWTAVSDRRLKTDIEPASDLLQAALELEPVRYYFKNREERGEKSLGLIAQDVQEVVPSLVTDGDPMTLNYAGMSVVAIGAIQGLYELVQELQAENAQMRAAMARAGIVEGSR